MKHKHIFFYYIEIRNQDDAEVIAISSFISSDLSDELLLEGEALKVIINEIIAHISKKYNVHDKDVNLINFNLIK